MAGDDERARRERARRIRDRVEELKKKPAGARPRPASPREFVEEEMRKEEPPRKGGSEPRPPAEPRERLRKSRTSLDSLRSREVQLAAAAGTSPTGIPPLMTVEAQCRSNWCWAAVTVSVAKLFGKTEWISQCQLAFAELSPYRKQLAKSDCCDGRCDAALGGACSLAFDLASPMRRAGVLADPPLDGPIDVDQIRDQLTRSLPVCIYVEWPDGSSVGHYLAIVGMQTDAQGVVQLETSDPIFGSAHMDWNTLKHAYRTGGQWMQTFLTKR